MNPFRIVTPIILCVPFFAHALTPDQFSDRIAQLRTRPEKTFLVTPTPSSTPDLRERDEKQPSSSLAPLRQREQAPKLARVLGLVRGMKNKLTNVSQRLDAHVAAVDARISSLRTAGHTLSVETEYNALQLEIAKAKQEMNVIIAKLDAIPESENPRTIMQEIRPMLSSFRTTMQGVQKAFQALSVAVRTDLDTPR